MQWRPLVSAGIKFQGFPKTLLLLLVFPTPLNWRLCCNGAPWCLLLLLLVKLLDPAWAWSGLTSPRARSSEVSHAVSQHLKSHPSPAPQHARDQKRGVCRQSRGEDGARWAARTWGAGGRLRNSRGTAKLVHEEGE